MQNDLCFSPCLLAFLVLITLTLIAESASAANTWGLCPEIFGYSRTTSFRVSAGCGMTYILLPTMPICSKEVFPSGRRHSNAYG